MAEACMACMKARSAYRPVVGTGKEREPTTLHIAIYCAVQGRYSEFLEAHQIIRTCNDSLRSAAESLGLKLGLGATLHDLVTILIWCIRRLQATSMLDLPSQSQSGPVRLTALCTSLNSFFLHTAMCSYARPKFTRSVRTMIGFSRR